MEKNRKLFYRIFSVLMLVAYLGLTMVLIIEAAKPGNESAAESNKFAQSVIDKTGINVGTQIEEIKPTDLIVELLSRNYYIGEYFLPTVKIEPENASKKILLYSSSDPNVIKFDSKYNKFYCVSAGTCEITVKIKDTDMSKTVTAKVVRVEGKSIDFGNVPILKAYQKQILTVKVLPTNTTNKKIVWESSDESILKVSNYNGSTNTILLETFKEGTVLLKGTLDSGASSSVTLKVLPADGNPAIVIDHADFIQDNNIIDSIELNEKQSKNLNWKIEPGDAYNQFVYFKSSNYSVASIDSSGKLTAGLPGEAIITMYNLFNNEAIGLLKVKVNSIETKFEIENELNEDGKLVLDNHTSTQIKLRLIQMPSNYQIKYVSSNPSVVEVSASGVINVKSYGTSTIKISIIQNDKEVASQKLIVQSVDDYAQNMSTFRYFIRKAFGHFGSFFVLGGIGILFILLKYRKKFFYIMPSLILGFTIAGLTEVIQKYTPGRCCAIKDVMIDFSGYSIATIGVYVVYIVVRLLIVLFKHNKITDNNIDEII